MRKIVVMLSVSLDGYFEGPDRDLGWPTIDDELHQEFNDYLRGASAFLSGRVTHELMVDYWPTADSDPSASAPVVEYAGIWRDKPKVVYSRTRDRLDWATTVVHDVVAEEVQALKDQPGGDLALGGADLLESFRRLDLVDEYRLYVHPVVLGAGRPLFGSGLRTPLRLVETHTFGSGVVRLRYARG